MPNPDLVPLLVDRATRRRLTPVVLSGRTTYTHQDLPDVPCAIRAKRRPVPQMGRAGYGRVPEADYLVTLHPDADVVQGDLLLATAGASTGRVLDVKFVHPGTYIAQQKADAKLMEAEPASTPASEP